MCGICGFSGKIEKSESILENMMEKIKHRGPDDCGRFLSEDMSIGYRRLNIIDSDGASQPIYNEDNTLVLAFDGKIYNYISLREELTERGHIFTSDADSEVILHGYEEYGEEWLNRLRGMFSFVIYNTQTRTLFAARDCFGIKPFYYAVLDNEIVFASEIKAILEHPAYNKEINETALENYLTFQYSVLEETFFKGIFKLLPAHTLKFSSEDGPVTQRYWTPEFAPLKEASLERIVNAIDTAVADSIEAHKIGDVEIASLLSGGVDSSYVAAQFGERDTLKTFSVGFEYDKYNEVAHAKELAEQLGVKNFDKIISNSEFWNILPKIQYHMDEPMADSSAVALYYATELAGEQVKVAFSGEGADELFGGYNIYKEPLDLKILTDLPRFIRLFLGAIASALPFNIKGKNFFIRGSKSVEERFIGNAMIFSKVEREAIMKNPQGKYSPTSLTSKFYDEVRHLDDITKMQYIDLHFWMPGDILLKVDKMSAANSIELRSPLLDKEIFEMAAKIPVNYKVNQTATKYAFRMASRNVLPEESAARRKLGFPVPIRLWLKEDKYYNIVKEAFESDAAERFFKVDKLMDILDRHRTGKVDYSRKIWTVYTFLVWYKVYFCDMEKNNTEFE